MKKKIRKAPIIIICLLIAALIVTVVVFIVNDLSAKAYREYMLMMYPRQYSELIEQYAEENGVDKNIIYAIVRTESSFNTKAESSVGARGLMQIMEPTYDWIKYRLSDTSDITYDDMFESEANIKYGCYLVGYLYRYYGNDTCALAAYHAGTGSVDSWLEKSEYSSDGVTLKEVPTDDTAHYVDKVISAYRNYLELYEKEKE